MPPRVLNFDDIEVNLAARLVTRNGAQLRIAGKRFDLLVKFLEHPEACLSYETLLGVIRQGGPRAEHLTVNDLYIYVSKLRNALPSKAGDREFYIRTVVKRGYMFMRPVCEQSRAPRSTSDSPSVETAGLARSRELCVAARLHWEQRNPTGVAQAIQLWEKAVECCPTNDEAYAGLAHAYAMLSSFGFAVLSPDEAMRPAEAHAMQALQLNPSSAPAHAVLSLVTALYRWDWKVSLEHGAAAVRLGPAYATGRMWYGQNLVSGGRFDEGLAEIEKACEIDQVSPMIATSRFWALHFARRTKEAIAAGEAFLRLRQSFTPALDILGWAYERDRQYAKALHCYETAEATPTVEASRGSIYALIGQASRAQETLKRLASMRRRRERGYVSPYLLAVVHVALGEANSALGFLEEAYTERSEWLAMLAVEPRFDRLRREKRFRDLLQRLGLPELMNK